MYLPIQSQGIVSVDVTYWEEKEWKSFNFLGTVRFKKMFQKKVIE